MKVSDARQIAQYLQTEFGVECLLTREAIQDVIANLEALLEADDQTLAAAFPEGVFGRQDYHQVTKESA